MNRMTLTVFTAIALAGCASQQLHAVGTPDMPQVDANLACMHYWFDQPVANALPVVGALGYATLDADARGHPIYVQCLANHGWFLPSN